jgi:hypothetical protein
MAGSRWVSMLVGVSTISSSGVFCTAMIYRDYHSYKQVAEIGHN